MEQKNKTIIQTVHNIQNRPLGCLQLFNNENIDSICHWHHLTCHMPNSCQNILSANDFPRNGFQFGNQVIVTWTEVRKIRGGVLSLPKQNANVC